MHMTFVLPRCLCYANYLAVFKLVTICFFIANVHGLPPLNDETIRYAVRDYHLNYYNDDTSNVDPIEQWNTSRVTNMGYLFLHSLVINGDLSQWDTSQVTNMQGMFEGASNFNGDLSQWDVSKVTNVKSMFSTAASFNGDLSQWDVSKVEDMQGMFTGASSYNGDLSQWDVSNVSFMHYMFYKAQSFNVDLSQWDVSKVSKMDGMFGDATCFDQELCWDVSSSIISMFDDSPGRLAQYPLCVNIPTYTPTKIPSFNRRVTLSTAPSLGLTDTPTTSPTTELLKIKSWKIPYTMSPTASPSVGSTDTRISSPSGPFWITSFLSMDDQQWCMRPQYNTFTEGTRISIATCKEWKCFKWIIDYEGKIISYKDPSMCVQMLGKRLTLQKCVDGLTRQRWIYSSNGLRILSIRNKRRGITVLDGSAFQGALLKTPIYASGKPTDSEKWEIKYDFTSALSVPSYDTFRIVSHLSTENDRWCLYPAFNSPVNGIKIAISTCKEWKTYKWMMDSEGKVLSVQAPNKCIMRSHNIMIINECEDGNEYQMWIYSVLDKKLVPMKNGLLQATVEDGIPSINAQVKLLQSVSPGPPHQTWEMEEI